MSVIALVGEKDPALGAARSTVKLLGKKVKLAEIRVQPDLAHEIPDELMPGYYEWLKIREGRYTPGESTAFDWYHNSDSARDEMKEESRGGLFYFYSDLDGESADAKHLEHEVFLDERVRFFGRQLTPALILFDLEPKLFESYGFAKTPAIVVLDADGTVVGKFTGRIEADALADALKKVAAVKDLPKAR
jgi:hypothetical protein